MSFFKKNNAAVFIEFALCAPVLIAIFLGMYEIYYYYSIHSKMEDIACKVGMWSSLDASSSSINSYLDEAYVLGESIDFDTKGAVIVSGLETGMSGSNNTLWQITRGTATSSVGSSSPSLSSASYLLNYNSIVVEVFYDYSPVFSYSSSFINSRNFKKTFSIDYRGPTAFPSGS